MRPYWGRIRVLISTNNQPQTPVIPAGSDHNMTIKKINKSSADFAATAHGVAALERSVKRNRLSRYNYIVVHKLRGSTGRITPVFSHDQRMGKGRSADPRTFNFQVSK